MAFIDIFNFKKYFSKPSDSQVARYGHVNAVYDALSTNSTVQVINVPNSEYSIFMTANKAVISLNEDVTTIPYGYTIYHPSITTNSIININLVMFTDNSGAPIIYGDYQVSFLCSSILPGQANCIYSTTSEIAQTDIVKFYIEIINP